MRISRSCLIELLRSKNCNHLGKMKGKDVWVTHSPHNLIIRLPETGDIPYGLVEIICIEIFDMGPWDFDYFLGQCGGPI
jgi:hypothetical protein